jgi:hypothetical protein
MLFGFDTTHVRLWAGQRSMQLNASKNHRDSWKLALIGVNSRPNYLS